MFNPRHIPDWQNDAVTQEYLDQDYSTEPENFEPYRVAIEREQRKRG